MPYKIKANEDTTVTFLGVFAKNEDRFFTDTEVDTFASMLGVPFDSALPDGFKVEKVSQKAVEEGKKALAAAALAEQEKTVAAQVEQPVVEEKKEKA
jgi:hypothetical protein